MACTTWDVSNNRRFSYSSMVRLPRSTRYMRLIRTFDNDRSISCALFCIGRYLCVRSNPAKALIPLPRLDAQISHRRRGFSKRATAAMFVTTIVNLLLFSLNTGTQLAIFVMVVRKPLDVDIDSPLSDIGVPMPGSVNRVSQNMILVTLWASYLPVSIKLSPSALVSNRACWTWRYGLAILLSFGGLGSSSKIDSG